VLLLRVLEPRSVSSPVIRRWPANGSCRHEWDCTPLPARRSRDDVDRCAAVLKEMNATIVCGPMEGTWAPGFYYVLFEDPDGIRLEVNFVPGAGLLAEGAQFNPATGYV